MSGIRQMLAGLACVAAAAGCRPDRPAGEAPQAAPPVEAPRSGSRDVVVARIGERTITYGEIEDRLAALPVFVRMRYQSPERKVEFLEAYVQFQVLALAADAEGIGAEGAVRDALKTEIVDRYLRDHVDAKVLTTDIPEERIVEYYRTHLFEFRRPEQSQVLHIRVADRALAEKVAFRARRGTAAAGADGRDHFASLVVKYSDDESTRSSGGDIGLFPRLSSDPRKVPAAVAEVASRMTEVGEVRGPVEAEDGFHILYLAARTPAVDLTLDQARPQIVAKLMDELRERTRREVVQGLLASARVEVDEAVFRKVAGLPEAR